MIVPMSSPGSPDRTTWAVECNRCQRREPGGTLTDWLISDYELDVHLCPRCERRVSRAILTASFGRSSLRVRASTAALRLLGVRP